MDNENIQFGPNGPVLTLADGTEVAVEVSTVETEHPSKDHYPAESMMAYLSNPDGHAIYGESVDSADAAVSFTEIDDD